MEFKKYNKIENSYNTSTITKIMHNIDQKQHFVALEKIHGANFSVSLDVVTRDVKCAKRSGFIGDNASFYSFERVKVELSIKIKKLAGLLGAKSGVVTVHGELFGGGFYGNKVEEAKRVQQGVHYHPDTKFMAFDISVDGDYIYWAKAERLLREAGFDITPTIAVTESFTDALELNETFQSMVPLYYGLIAQDNENFAEGIVIKPLNAEYTLPNGKRLILKKKTEKFSEKKKKTKVPKIELSEDTKEIFADVCTYICENRLNNVISKLGDLTAKDFGKVLGLFVQDAVHDYEEEVMEGDTLKQLLGDEWKTFNKALNTVARDLIRVSWAEILEG